VPVIDALAVYKDAEGEIETEHLGNLSIDEAIELGSKIGALLGLAVDGEEGIDAGAVAGADAAADGVEVFTDEDAGEVLDDIPNDRAAALLLEHQWAVPLRDAVIRAGGFRLADGFISPSTSSKSACSPLRKPANSTSWSAAPTRRPRSTTDSTRLGGVPCSDRAEVARHTSRRVSRRR
jgi:hypothetical protein